MHILVVSAQWPSDGKTGLGVIAAKHVEFLAENGYQVSALGISTKFLDDVLIPAKKYYISSRGSGALYSPSRISLEDLRHLLNKIKPSLIIVQGWQTGLSEAVVKVGNELGINILLISHGVSVHPFTYLPRDLLRSAGWFFYRNFVLRSMIRRLSGLTALDLTCDSNRFHDRKLASKLSVPVYKLQNFPIHMPQRFLPFSERKRQLLVVGYFSYIKNQLAAINMLLALPSDIKLIFLGRKSGAYYERCLALVDRLKLADRIQFVSDDECSVSALMAESIVVLSTSITEAMPINLIEASASGTPFVARSIGAIPSLNGGRCFRDDVAMIDEVRILCGSPSYWNIFSKRGLEQYRKEFTEAQSRLNFLEIVQNIKYINRAGNDLINA